MLVFVHQCMFFYKYSLQTQLASVVHVSTQVLLTYIFQSIWGDFTTIPLIGFMSVSVWLLCHIILLVPICCTVRS